VLPGVKKGEYLRMKRLTSSLSVNLLARIPSNLDSTATQLETV
jgi:hypothetical protein